MRPMSEKKIKNLDPLYQLFEHYLLTRSYEDSGAFTKSVAEEYIAYLDSTNAHVPMHCRQTVMEDLESEAHELLVKKMYGTVKPSEYQNTGNVIKIQKNTEFSRFEFTPPSERASNNTDKKE